MSNVPDVCRAEEPTENAQEPKVKQPTTKKMSPWLQLFKLRLSSSKTPRPDTDDSLPPPVFALANKDDPDDFPLAPASSVYQLGSLSAAGTISDREEAPSVAQAAVHLVLLEVFWSFKERFLHPSDEYKSFFGAALGWLETRKWDEADNEMLWKTVIEIAVGRFEAWWKVVGREVEGTKWDDREREGVKYEPKDGPGKKITELPAEMLPPIDVLMVWHSYMLNPRNYYDDCYALGLPGMLAVAFPWEAVKNAINQTTLEYKLPAEAEAFFRVSTSQNPDLFSQLKAESFSKPRLPMLEIACPQCEHEHEIAIASDNKSTPAWHSPGLQLTCSCRFTITHDALCAERLRQDIKQVLSGGPGTRGTFSPPFESANINTLLKEHYGTTTPTLSSHPTVSSLLDFLPKPGMVKQFYQPTSPWSSASISLSAAVIRQASFIDKMHHSLWIRGPSAGNGTLSRAKEKYENFFRLFFRHPGETMVPTLDVDVFWHTHQLSPARYYYFCLSSDAAGRFINHNDQLSTGVLDDGFQRTGERYWEEFEMEYGGCFCWPCELERDDKARGPIGWWMRARKEKRTKWERRVKVAFWREVEKRRREGGEEQVGLKGLAEILQQGPKPKKQEKATAA
ncbi:hypothetical protein FN846DRAFT_934634 [Sphaerosporella brunnea]|uniref:Uncharacterized protein n=1 Tax=Sphaerosporella brunnea TaxID=1250544 RepID=A0A5J5F5W5_9PEZI|nr:hypothetical protein FN846DRAFT_934634 [Sphaerosporella brunnea]